MSDTRYNFEESSPVYEFKLGDELRGERATLGKSLLDVQRDLRIKAAYIAAIENCEPDVFPNPGFIAGYVRSYARYLNLDPDVVYRRFCQESGFSGATGNAVSRGPSATGRPGAGATLRAPGAGGFSPDFPVARAPGFSLADLPVSAIGSMLVLVGLIAGLGYGGWTVLQNIQRVQFAPVDEVPTAVAEVDALAPPAPEVADPVLPELASPVAATALAELYRQQELEVPILVPRDGPIAALDPESVGPMAGRGRVAPAKAHATVVGPPRPVETAEAAPEPAQQGPEPQVVAPPLPELTIVAERAAWIRVYLEDGTVVFERILERGEVYTPPTDLGVPLLWAGNSGSVYVRVGETLHGPVGSGTRAVRDVPLDPAKIVERFAAVSEIPEAISRTFADNSRQVTESAAMR